MSMNPDRRFTKRYRDTAACQTALANYRWLATLQATVGLPRLLATAPRQLVFERVRGRHAIPADLVVLARALGDLHGAAHATALRHARLDRAYRTDAGHLIPDFVHTRLPVLQDRLANFVVPAPNLDLAEATQLLRATAGGPAALYKDANPRNFLLTADRVIIVDADDLTLAPFGYDLAKLVVTLAMTHGPLSTTAIHQAIDAYDQAACRHHCGLSNISLAELLAWAEIHHILTSPYLGQHGYHHGWHTLRPPLATAQLRLQDSASSWP